MALFRRRRLPAARRPKLDGDERIVAWAAAWSGPQGDDRPGPPGEARGPERSHARARPGGVTGDDVLVLTTYGIWLPGATVRLGWHEIHKATWSGRQLGLVPAEEVGVGEGYVVVADRPAVVHTLLDPDHVPAQVHARVTKSIAYTQHHPLPGGGGVRVVARRVPGVNGLRWTVRYDEEVDPSVPEIATLTAELVEYGRASL